MILKKAIQCLTCDYTGKALVLRSSIYEKIAIFGLIVFSVVLPPLLIYTIPLLAINLFLPPIQLCPLCKSVKLLSEHNANSAGDCH